MALVDLKSKLNEFGKNNPDNPYQKGDRETNLESNVDVDNEKYLEIGENPESQLTKIDSEYDRENTPKSNIKRESSFGRSIKSFVEDFGRSSFDVPTTGNYEDIPQRLIRCRIYYRARAQFIQHEFMRLVRYNHYRHFFNVYALRSRIY